MTGELVERGTDLNRIVGRDGGESERRAVRLCAGGQAVEVECELSYSRSAAECGFG